MTTIVADHVDANVYDAGPEGRPYFSWGAAIAGALAASMVTFMLLAIGAGLGLMLAGPVNNPAPLKTILTAGGIYFFAVEAFGFAVGGYIAGRLCGPALQSRDEEMFRSGAHGLIVWALSAGACLLFLAVGVAVAANATANLASTFGISAAQKGPTGDPTPATVSYWTDTLFRAPGAGAVTTTTTTQPAPAPTPAPVTTAPTTTEPTPTPAPTEATPAPSDNVAPNEPSTNGNAPTNDNSGDQTNTINNSGDANGNDDGDETQPTSPSPAVYVPMDSVRAHLIPIQYSTTTTTDASGGVTTHIDSDAQAEVSRVLMANAAKPNEMRADDRQYIEQTIVTQVGVSQGDARQRLDALLARINDQETKAAETARKAAAYMNIWLGLSLLFGLLVATGSAVLARMEEEKKGEEAGSVRIPPTVTPPPTPAV